MTTGPGFSIVSGPASEAGADPGGEGQRAFAMGGFLFFGLAFERRRDGFESGPVSGFKNVLERSSGAAVAVLDHLHAGDAGHKGHRTQRREGGSLDGDALDVETFGLDGAQQLLNHPAAAVELRDPARLLEPRRRLVHNLVHRHLVIAQKPSDANLARSTATQTADRKTPRAVPDKTLMQKPTRPVPENRLIADHASPLSCYRLNAVKPKESENPQIAKSPSSKHIE